MAAWIQKEDLSIKKLYIHHNGQSSKSKCRSQLVRAASAILASIIFALRKDYVIKTQRELRIKLFFFQVRDCYVRSRQSNCFIFLLTNSVEALLEEERSQRAQVETGLDKDD